VLPQEPLIGTVLTLATDTAGAVNSVTLRYREAGNLLQGRSPSYLFAYARRAFGGNGDGDEIAPTKDVSSDYSLLKRYE
jgi:hypothetical protein